MTEPVTLYFDTETFCETPIKHGTHRYAEDAEIMVLSYAIDDPLLGEGEIKVVDLANGDPWPQDLLDAIADPEVVIVGHNFSSFDRTVLRHALGIEIPVERIEDTMVQAQSHGLPGGLDKLCAIFKVPEALAKMKEGKSLIGLFCMPRPKNSILRRATKATHPVEWGRFLQYAGSDISSMRYLRKVMPRWNYPGAPKGNSPFSAERRLHILDQKINDRGLAVDTVLAESAVDMVARHQKVMAKRMNDLTDGEVEAATQRDRLLKHLLEQYGVNLPDMQKGTLERRINDENLPWIVRELLALRLEASGTSQAKYGTLLKGVSADGRLRGTLVFCGAARTGRWAGRLFQPHNLPRPTLPAEEIEEGIEIIKGGCGDLLLDEPMRVASSAIRGCIVAGDGRKLVIADLSNIEGRIAAWLADETWKLEAFRLYDTLIYEPDGSPRMILNQKGKLEQARAGPDLYNVTAGGILNKLAEHVTPDERQSYGKVSELACGFQGAVGAFATMAQLLGVDITDQQAVAIVKGWREKNKAIRNYWYELDDKCREAILQPGVVTTAGRIRFHVSGNWLRVQLPSGRMLCYSGPAIVDHPIFEGKTSVSYMGVNGYTRQWERIHTYGGKIFENIVQATARDVIASSMENAEEAGFPIILTVHDELITEPLDTNQYTSERLEQLLSAAPFWADSKLPLAASGFETYRYAKH